jgi:hypothetical protein
MAELRNGGMAELRNGGIAKWRNGADHLIRLRSRQLAEHEGYISKSSETR